MLIPSRHCQGWLHDVCCCFTGHNQCLFWVVSYCSSGTIVSMISRELADFGNHTLVYLHVHVLYSPYSNRVMQPPYVVLYS